MLQKISGRNARKERARIGALIDRKAASRQNPNGVKLGDLTNGEMHTWDRAKSALHGHKRRKEKGAKAKFYANWAKNDRAEPGNSNIVGTGGNQGEGALKPKYSKNDKYKEKNVPLKLGGTIEERRERLRKKKEHKAAQEKFKTETKNTADNTKGPNTNNTNSTKGPNTNTAKIVRKMSTRKKMGIGAGLIGLGALGTAAYIKHGDYED